MKEMYSLSSLALFGTTLLIFIFGIIQIAYYFQVKEYQDSNDDRRILINTFVGFILMIAAYMILLITLFIKEDSWITKSGKALFSLLCFISMILLFVAIGATQESHSMKSVSIMVPILLAINALMVSAPLLSNISISLPSSRTLQQPNYSLRNVSQPFLNASERIKEQPLPKRNVTNFFQHASEQVQKGSRKNVSRAFHEATRRVHGNK
jgi:glucan phosphoethanolaminetransferase (alkaline phosphatase superfamily)